MPCLTIKLADYEKGIGFYCAYGETLASKLNTLLTACERLPL